MYWKTEFSSYQDAFIEDLKGLIQIPSVRDDATACVGAPFGKGCKDALEYMKKLAQRDGFTFLEYDGYAGVVVYGDGKESVGVLAHLDVVPVGDGWHHAPYGAEIEQGYMFGRGVMDDKGPAMSGYYALKMLKDYGIQCNKKVMLILGCDEESGMECMEYYKKHGEIPTLGFTPDADFPVIYGEKGGLHVKLAGEAHTIIEAMHAGKRANVVIEEACALLPTWDADKESLFQFYLQTNQLQGHVEKVNDSYELHMLGQSAHGAMPYFGNNAALHLFNFVGTAYQDSFAKQVYALLYDWMGKGFDIAFNGAYMGFLTMNTGIVSIEDNQVSIALDIRYPNDMDVADIEHAMSTKVKTTKFPLQIEFHEKAKPLFVDPTSTLVTTLSDVYRKYSGDQKTCNKTIGGGTYAKKFDNFVAFGPEFPMSNVPEGLHVGSIHQSEEAVCLQDLFTSVAIYVESIERLAK